MFYNFELPISAQLRGGLERDSIAQYPIEDVLEIEFNDGKMIDVSWDNSESLPFRVVVYRDHFGKASYDQRLKTASEVHAKVQELINEH